MEYGTWGRRSLAAVAILALVAGCGTDAGTKPRRTGSDKLPSVQPVPGEYVGGPGGPGLPAGAAGQDDPQARALITRTSEAVRALPAYQLEMRWMQKKGSTVAKGVYDIIGKAPRTIRIDIKEGKGKGTKVLYTGGSTAKVRPDGVLGAITVDLSVNDDRLLSVRNYNIPQTDLKGMMDQLVDPRHKARILAQTQERVAIEVSGGALLKGCAKMVMEIDPNTALPLTIDQYDAREVVFHLDLRNFRPRKNASVDI